VSFWREMSRSERAAFRACFGGWALDGMDFQFYSFVIPTLIAGWGLTKAQAGTLQTTTLLASALGGWLAGLIADRNRPGADAADHHPLVRALHWSVRPGARAMASFSSRAA